MGPRCTLGLVVAISVLASAPIAGAADVPLFAQQQVIPAPVGTAEWFGKSVAVDGDVAMIGAPIAQNLLPGLSYGVVLVYERDGAGVWAHTSTLEPSTPVGIGRFGWSIDLCGDRALIGATFADVGDVSTAGAVFVVERNSVGVWVEVAMLESPEPVCGEGFGHQVDLHGDLAMVGPNYGAFNGLADAGFVCVYERDAAGSWIHVQTFAPEDVKAFDYFGRDFRIVGDEVLVGAALRDGAKTNEGGAFLFRRDAAGTWHQVDALVPPDGAFNGMVGEKVGFDGERATLSKRFDDYPVFNSGAAYVYERTPQGTFAFAEKLHTCESGPEDGLSSDLDQHGGLLALASLAEGPAGTAPGLIRLFAVGVDGAMLEAGSLYAITPSAPPKLDESLAIQGATVVAASGTPGAAVFWDLSSVQLLDTDPCPTLPGDFNGDGSIDAEDLQKLLYAWGPCVAHLESWKDLDGDFIVGPLDLALLLAWWTG